MIKNLIKGIILISLFLSITLTCRGQISFLDNFKTAKWKSSEKFNDSTLLLLDSLTLKKWDYSVDSIKHYPVFWIWDNEFKIKYYTNLVITPIQESAKINTIDCEFIFNEKENLLSITLDDKSRSVITYKVKTVSDSNIILVRQK